MVKKNLVSKLGAVALTAGALTMPAKAETGLSFGVSFPIGGGQPTYNVGVCNHDPQYISRVLSSSTVTEDPEVGGTHGTETTTQELAYTYDGVNSACVGVSGGFGSMPDFRNVGVSARTYNADGIGGGATYDFSGRDWTFNFGHENAGVTYGPQQGWSAQVGATSGVETSKANSTSTTTKSVEVCTEGNAWTGDSCVAN